MSTMIALVGEQPLPNLIPVRRYHPDNLLLVYTERTARQFKPLKDVIQKEAKVFGVNTSPYDIPTIENTIDEELTRLSKEISPPLIFNVTGGTKAMCLAAYQVAQQRNAPVMYLQSEGIQSRAYHYEWDGPQLKQTRNDLLHECIKLQDVFDLYFGLGPHTKTWQICGSKRTDSTQEQDGSFFEDALATVLEKHGYEVMVGVRGQGGKIDVDIAVRWDNQYGIIEAKLGNKGKGLKGIQQLHTARQHLGTYSRTFYIITVEPEPSQSEIVAAANIKVISLPGYNRTTHTLPLDQEIQLLNEIETVLKG